MLDIKELYLKDYIDQEITVSGWIKNHRKRGSFWIHRLIRWNLLQRITSSL